MVQHLETLVRASKGTLPTPSSEEEDDMQWYLEGQGFDAKAYARTRTNPWIGDKLVPVHSKVEDVSVDQLRGEEKVDTIVSECLGVLLVHERMVSRRSAATTISSLLIDSPRSLPSPCPPNAVRILPRRPGSLPQTRWCPFPLGRHDLLLSDRG